MGGRAFTNVQPITLDDYSKLLPVLGVELITYGAKRIIPIGSTGKAPVMGDIDLAIEYPSGRDALYEFFTRLYGDDCAHRHGSRQLSIRYPVLVRSDIQIAQQYVQLDLVICAIGDTAWAEWSHHSPGSSSPVKGVIRNLLLNTILREKTTSYDGDNRKRLLIDWDVGLFEAMQEKRFIENAPFKTRFEPHWHTIQKTFVTDDPTKLINIVFGVGYGAKDALTFENVVKLTPEKTLKIFVNEMEKLAQLHTQHFGDNVGATLDYIGRTCFSIQCPYEPYVS